MRHSQAGVDNVRGWGCHGWVSTRMGGVRHLSRGLTALGVFHADGRWVACRSKVVLTMLKAGGRHGWVSTQMGGIRRLSRGLTALGVGLCIVHGWVSTMLEAGGRSTRTSGIGWGGCDGVGGRGC